MDMVEVFGILLLKVKVFGIPLLKLLEVLVVPLTVAAAVPFFTWRQRRREEFIGKQRAQDEALQAYLGQMSQLLLDKDRPLLQSGTDSEVQEEDRQRRSKLSGLFRVAEYGRGLLCKPGGEPGMDSEESTSEASTLAKARTLTVLTRLDGERKRSVVDFLFEARLICKSCKGLGEWPLKEADLRGAHLGEAHLVKTNLSYARLSEADLKRADLRGADLHGAKLSEAVLSGARLGPPREGEDAEPNPTPADLSGADLRGADLRGADLSSAIGVTAQQLDMCKSRAGATMPNGQKYEDWLKDKKVITCLGE
jgi:Pentapeptide repeats (8 copies)